MGEGEKYVPPEAFANEREWVEAEVMRRLADLVERTNREFEAPGMSREEVLEARRLSSEWSSLVLFAAGMDAYDFQLYLEQKNTTKH